MSAQRTRSFLTFSAGGETLAVAAEDVAEIARLPRFTRMPGAPPSLMGLAGMRGAIVPVVSLSRLMETSGSADAESRVLLMSGQPPVGLAVDRVGVLTDMVEPEGVPDPAPPRTLYAVGDGGLRPIDIDALLREAFPHNTAGRSAATETATVEDASEDRRQLALLTFEVSGQRYALSLDEVAEVLTLPPTLTPVAQSDAAVLGVQELRGQVLPVVSLRRLLGLEPGGMSSGHIVVVRIGGARVGVAVDRVEAVLRVSEGAVDPAPVVLNRSDGEAQVQAICRLPEGGGLVGVLAARHLFQDDRVAEIVAQAGADRDDGLVVDTAMAERHLLFQIGGEDYGVPLATVEAVVSLPARLTRPPRAPAFVAGVINHRGAVTPVIDQRVRFEGAAAAPDRRPRIVVTADGGRRAGFIVDSVSEVRALNAGRIEQAPAITAEVGRLFPRIATTAGSDRLTLMLDPRELMNQTERDILAGLDAGTGLHP